MKETIVTGWPVELVAFTLSSVIIFRIFICVLLPDYIWWYIGRSTELITYRINSPSVHLSSRSRLRLQSAWICKVWVTSKYDHQNLGAHLHKKHVEGSLLCRQL